MILCANRDEAVATLAVATDFLGDELALKLNENTTPLVHLDEGFCWLGICFRGPNRTIDPEKLAKAQATADRSMGQAARTAFTETLAAHNRMTLGWRRYYGTVLPTAAVDPLDKLAIDALGSSVAAALSGKQLDTWGSALRALSGAQFVIQRTAKQQKHAICDVLRAARAVGRIRAESVVKTKLVSAPKTPRVPARATTAVRSRKRAHFRASSATSQLVVSTPGSFVGRSGQLVVVRRDRKAVARVRTRELEALTIASPGVTISADVIEHCASNNIPLLFVSSRAQLNAAVMAPSGRDAHIGMLQLEAIAKVRPALDIARRFVEGKLRNQANFLKYLHKYRKNQASALLFTETFGKCMEAFSAAGQELRSLLLLEEIGLERGRLMSVEGRAAAHYWEMIGLALRGKAEFEGRERQGARDLVNSMLNYGYAILESRVYLAVVAASLLPHAGFLHAFRNGKTALVYDLMEEFRPQVVDRTVVTMLSRGEPAEVDREGMLSDQTRGALAKRVLERLNSIVSFRGKEPRLEDVIRSQATALAKHLEGKSRYRSFVAGW